MVISDSADLRAEICRRLETLGSLHRLEPARGIVDEMRALIQRTKDVPIAWVEAGTSQTDHQQWRQALAELNHQRDLLGPVFLVLAGDSRAHELLSLQAPDLTHVLDPILAFDMDAE